METRLYHGVPFVSTTEFHAGRARAPHLEQPLHRPRLECAAAFVAEAAARLNGQAQVSDLGCGDGGLLSLVADRPEVDSSWGYDFQPSNASGWLERGVSAESLDVFGIDRAKVRVGSIAVVTEVLEHLADPHEALHWIRLTARFLVASSPVDETAESHDACHAWVWDMDGYAQMMMGAGWTVERHERVGQFQVVLAS